MIQFSSGFIRGSSFRSSDGLLSLADGSFPLETGNLKPETIFFMLDAARMVALLAPFLDKADPPPQLIAQLQTYLDLLLRWNASMNLTAVRDPEQIVTRHFGESLFAARALRDPGASCSGGILADIGSGAGFPGIPIKLLLTSLQLTLIESQNKKVTFLREVIRSLAIAGAEVFCGRAEGWPRQADIVTLRAVERFDLVLPIAAGRVAPGGTLCLLISSSQQKTAEMVIKSPWVGREPQPVPNTRDRVVFCLQRAGNQ